MLGALWTTRLDAYIEFSSAAWNAVEIRRAHGERSPEYQAARANVDKCRERCCIAADRYNAAK